MTNSLGKQGPCGVASPPQSLLSLTLTHRPECDKKPSNAEHIQRCDLDVTAKGTVTGQVQLD